MTEDGITWEPTWAEREYVMALREAGIEDVYCDLEEAPPEFWQALILASEAWPEELDAFDWNGWSHLLRWVTGLPEARSTVDLFKRTILDGRWPTGSQASRKLSVGMRLTAFEVLLSMLPGHVVKGLAAAINGRAAWFRVGVRLEGTRFAPFTSEHLHKEVTRPALLLLNDERFEKVDILYRKAFDRALANDQAGAVTAASSAIEEMLRVGLGRSGGQLKGLLDEARKAGWVLPAVQQMAAKVSAMRDQGDAHTAGTTDPSVGMLALHITGALLVHLGDQMPDA